MRARLGRKRNNSTMLRIVDIHSDCKVEIDSIMAGYHWIMHNHDKDINKPSCPHCHATDAPGEYKLNIYTGEFFEYPREVYKGKISKKEMKKMWEQKEFLENVISERQLYEETYHKTNPKRYPPLPPLPIVSKHGKLTVRITKRWIENNIRKVNNYAYNIKQ